ncbi:MAG: phosphomethylpyrimidine kinase [Bryobacterales bacterium]|nr:phosphomethylpyrimidine kinase [Bryobacterales bacterium]
MIPVALTIAGSDPSGGAGLQADLKIFHQFGVYGQAVATLLTVQNTLGVQRVETLPAELVIDQLSALLEDFPPNAAKTGALGSAEIVQALASAAERFGFPLVVDPVMLSKGGAALGTMNLRALIPHAALITPNLSEAAALSGFPVDSVSDMRRAAAALHDLGARAVLVKGGHLEGEQAIDVLLYEGRYSEFPAPRIETPHTHGTGCAYSAAITALLACGLVLPKAVERAKAFVTAAIRTNPGLGLGAGPLNHWA